MSGFEYYEFQAVDRKLTRDEVTRLRELSNRAKVSRDRAVFIYHYGSFRGNIDELLTEYFDAFLYISSFGTKELGFRIPTYLFNAQALGPYEDEDVVTIQTCGDHTVVRLYWSKEDGGGWVEEEECRDLLDDILCVREGLIKGDPRALYLTCLSHKHNIQEEDESSGQGDFLKSLPIPTNLTNLDSALESLASFFEIPDDVLQDIAQKSQ